jgi:hypothetical protein
MGQAVIPTLAGELGPFLATEVLKFLQLAQATGILELERDGERITIGLTDGRPVWSSTTGRAVRIGDVLVHRGWASRESLADALDEQRGRPERLGVLLRERGVTDDQVRAAVGEVFRRLVCLLALWPDGRFRFVPGSVSGDDAELEVELDRLIFEGLHQADLATST